MVVGKRDEAAAQLRTEGRACEAGRRGTGARTSKPEITESRRRSCTAVYKHRSRCAPSWKWSCRCRCRLSFLEPLYSKVNALFVSSPPQSLPASRLILTMLARVGRCSLRCSGKMMEGR
jgi:hypothetical protein